MEKAATHQQLVSVHALRDDMLTLSFCMHCCYKRLLPKAALFEAFVVLLCAKDSHARHGQALLCKCGRWHCCSTWPVRQLQAGVLSRL